VAGIEHAPVVAGFPARGVAERGQTIEAAVTYASSRVGNLLTLDEVTLAASQVDKSGFSVERNRSVAGTHPLCSAPEPPLKPVLNVQHQSIGLQTGGRLTLLAGRRFTRPVFADRDFRAGVLGDLPHVAQSKRFESSQMRAWHRGRPCTARHPT
jgi:hypothetical protein